MEYFDDVDVQVDGNGYVPRVDLKHGLIQFPKTKALQVELDAAKLVLERNEFAAIVKRFLNPTASRPVEPKPVPAPEPTPVTRSTPLVEKVDMDVISQVKDVRKVTRKELLDLYDSVDVDKAGFVSKRELKPVLRAKQQESGDEEVTRLLVMIEDYEKSLVEKYDYRDLLLKWDKDNIEARQAEKEELQAHATASKPTPRYN